MTHLSLVLTMMTLSWLEFDIPAFLLLNRERFNTLLIDRQFWTNQRKHYILHSCIYITMHRIGTTYWPAPSPHMTTWHRLWLKISQTKHTLDKYQYEVVVHIWWWLQDHVYGWPWILTAVDVVALGAVAGQSLSWPCIINLLFTMIVWPSWSYICCHCREAKGRFS